MAWPNGYKCNKNFHSKSKLEPKKFTKNPILGTKFTIAISSAKGGVGKSTFATNLALALKKTLLMEQNLQ